MENNDNNIIDLKKIIETLWNQRKIFYWVWPITFVLSAALILCVPRKYQSSVVLAPEGGSEGGFGSLGSLASSFGLDLGSFASSDAIQPNIYPEIIKSPDFLLPLFETQVISADGSIDMRYYDYIATMQKHPFWWYPKAWCIQGIEILKGNNLGGRPDTGTEQKTEFDPFWLNKIQKAVLENVQDNIKCTMDKKTDMITITVQDQDKLICATMADTVSNALQKFVTAYRTQKARTDAEYFLRMTEDASLAYQEACIAYTTYADSHMATNQERVRAELSRLQNEMDQKQSVYNTFQQQYIVATAKLQERTPIYTVIQSASVPTKAASPRRVRFVLMILILVTFGAACWIARKELFI